MSVLVTFYVVLAAIIAFLGLYLPRESKWNPFVLWDKQRNADGYTGGQDYAELLGQEGVAITTLRPAGTITLAGKRMDVSSTGDFLDKGTKVRIVKVEGSKIFVEKI